MSCNLSLDKNFNKNLLIHIQNALKLGRKDIELKLVEEIAKLREDYSSHSSKDFYDEILKAISANPLINFIGLKYNISNLREILRQSAIPEKIEPEPSILDSIEETSKTDSISETPSEKRERFEDAFLASYFPMSSDAKLTFFLHFANDILTSVFFNTSTDSWSLTTSNEDMNNSIKSYINTLEKHMDAFIKEFYLDSVQNWNVLNLSGKIRQLGVLINNGIIKLDRLDLILFPVIDMLEDTDLSKRKLVGYSAVVALLNFDELVEHTFGDAISIAHKGNLTTKEIKYSLNLGNKNSVGWSDLNDDRDETEEIGSIMLLYFLSIPLYDIYGNKLNVKFTFTLTKNTITAIMKLLDSPALNHKKIALSDAKQNNLLEDLKDFYGTKSLLLIRNILNNYTVGQLISAAKLDPTMYMPLLLGVLYYRNSEYFSGKYQVRLGLITLWKNLITDSNSLLRCALRTKQDDGSTGLNYKTPDLYSFVCTLFVNLENTPYIGYKREPDGKVNLINLTQNNDSRRLRNLQQIWEGFYNIQAPLEFRSFKLSDFQKKDGEIIKKLEVTLGSYILEIEDINGTIETHLYRDDRTIVTSESINNSVPNEVRSFLSEVFHFNVDDNFLTTYRGLNNNVLDLLKIAGNILYNYKVGKTIYESYLASASETFTVEYFNSMLSLYYKDSKKVRTFAKSILPTLIPSNIFTIVSNLTKARDLVLGHISESTARDGENKQLSIQGLSQLASRYMELVENYNKKQADSIVKDFVIYDIFGGMEYIRDYTSATENTNAVKFTSKEFYESSFLYDYYGTQSYEDNGTIIIPLSPETVESRFRDKLRLRVFGPIISDKSKIARIGFDWFSAVNGNYLKNLTTDEIWAIKLKEFGEYYSKVHQKILSTFNLLKDGDRNYVDEVLQGLQGYNKNVNYLDYDNNFETLNLLASQNNVTAIGLLHDILVAALLDYLNRGLDPSNIKLIHGVSYIVDKKGNLHNNPALFHLLSIYGRIDETYKFVPDKFKIWQILETPEESRLRLQHQLIGELILGNVCISTASKDLASQLAESRNKGWLKGNHIIYARIGENSTDNNAINLIDKSSFTKWNVYRRFISLFGKDPRWDISSPKFDLLDTLKVLSLYNQYASLFDNLALLTDNVLLDDAQKESVLKREFLHWGEEAILKHLNDAKISEYFIKHEIIDSIENLDITSLEYYAEKAGITKGTELHLFVNPEIERHSALNNWLYESYMLTSAGSFIAHPGAGNTIWKYEQSQFGQQVKRNVSLTASKHREVLNTLTGIRKKLRMAVIEEERSSATTYQGFSDPRAVKHYDGATYYNMTMMFLDNFSLGADAMGLDKKPFTHSLVVDTGQGIIVKTAGFPITNLKIRESERNAALNKHMNDSIKWSQTLKLFEQTYGPISLTHSKGFDWTVNFNGNLIQIPNLYVLINNLWYVRYNFKFNPESGRTTYEQAKVYINGEIDNSDSNLVGLQDAGVIDSNYQLWKLFGGEYSGHFNKDGYLTIVNDNTSTKTLVDVMNQAGILYGPMQDSEIKSQANVFLVLKESQIDMCPTEGAVKFGIMNINSTEMFDNPDYIPTWFEVDSSDFGEQLDAEHTAEDGQVALMTQVMGALSARGYSRETAQECYEALEQLAIEKFRPAFEAVTSEDPSKLKTATAQIILSALRNILIADGNILTALVMGIKNLNIKSFDDFLGQFAISDPRIFKNLISKLSSQLEKTIRLKFEGGQYVLTPSNRIFKFIGNVRSSNVTDELVKTMQQDAKQVTESADLLFGRTYYYFNGDELKLKQIDVYEDWQFLNDLRKQGVVIFEAFMGGVSAEVSEGQLKNVILPENVQRITRDLASYECSISDGLNRYSLYETNAVTWMFSEVSEDGKFVFPRTEFERLWNQAKTIKFNNEQEFEEWLEEHSTLKTYFELLDIKSLEDDVKDKIKSYFQKVLNTITGQGSTKVYIEEIDKENNSTYGKIIDVKFDLTKTFPYECILPMIYKTSFGLREGDEVNVIENDPLFFAKRSLSLIESKLVPSIFTLELKKTNGNHVYLHYAKGNKSLPFFALKVELHTVFDGSNLWRVDDNGHKLYTLPYETSSKGEVISLAQIFKINGQEIISTDNLTHFLDSETYSSIVFGTYKDVLPETLFAEILKAIHESTNETAQNTFKGLITLANNRINRHKNLLLNKETLDEKSKATAEYLEHINLAESILQSLEITEENFFNSIAVNSIYHSDTIENQFTKNHKDFEKFKADLHAGLSYDQLISKYPQYKYFLRFSKSQHSSFLQSLYNIVSRTPAQSQLSFMSMKCVGFDLNTINSIYISRMLLLLQGSDYALK